MGESVTMGIVTYISIHAQRTKIRLEKNENTYSPWHVQTQRVHAYEVEDLLTILLSTDAKLTVPHYAWLR